VASILVGSAGTSSGAGIIVVAVSGTTQVQHRISISCPTADEPNHPLPAHLVDVGVSVSPPSCNLHVIAQQALMTHTLSRAPD